MAGQASESEVGREWLRCAACGHWTPESTGACPRCGWSLLLRDHAGDAIHVLVEVDVYEGTCEVSGIHSDRWPEWSHPAAVDWLAGEVDLSQAQAHVRSKKTVPAVGVWEKVAVRVREAFIRALHGRLVGGDGFTVAVSVRIRVLDLEITANNGSELPPWLVVAPPEAISARGAEELGPEHLKITVSGSLSLAPDGRLSTLVITSARDTLLTRVQAASGPGGKDGRVRAEAGRRVVLKAGRPSTVTLPWTHAGAHEFVKDHEERAESMDWVVLHMHGRNKPIGLRTPPLPRSLPKSSMVANIHLDLGSTVSKVLVTDGEGHHIFHRAVGTDALCGQIGAGRYDKATLLADPKAWSAWVRAALPGIQQEAARHGRYLGDVTLCLPSVASLQIDSFAAGVGLCPDHATGTVRVHTEHALLHAHFLATLSELRAIGQNYVASTSKRDREADQRDAERAEHQRKKSKFDDRTWFGKLFHSDPGSPPAVLARLPRPADWMSRLSQAPDRLDRVVLLDAGGLSLDVAVEEKGVPVPLLSKSLRCGGEDISEAMGRARGSSSTAYKVGLAQRFVVDAPLDHQLVQYRDATRAVCAAFVPLASMVTARWGPASSLVIVTGGGARNPFFVQFVKEAFGPEAWVVSDDDIAEYVRSLQQFGMRANGAIAERFLEVRGWNEDGPPEMLYDKFAIVGGMRAI